MLSMKFFRRKSSPMSVFDLIQWGSIQAVLGGLHFLNIGKREKIIATLPKKDHFAT